MSKGNTFENDLMLLIFNGTSISGIATAAAGTVYVALHTADPGEAGNQSTNECGYTGYARVAVARTSAGWTVASGTASNAAEITFGKNTAGTNTASYASVGSATTGTGTLFYSGTLGTALVITPNIIPYFAAGDLDITED